MIICLGRESGSGGHEIGKQLAEALDVPFYSCQLVDMAVGRGKPVYIRAIFGSCGRENEPAPNR